MVALFAAIVSLSSVASAAALVAPAVGVPRMRMDVLSLEGTVPIDVAPVITEFVNVMVTCTVFVTPWPWTTKLTTGPTNVPLTNFGVGAVGVAVTAVDAGDSTEFTTALTVYEYAVPFVKPVWV